MTPRYAAWVLVWRSVDNNTGVCAEFRLGNPNHDMVNVQAPIAKASIGVQTEDEAGKPSDPLHMASLKVAVNEGSIAVGTSPKSGQAWSILAGECST